MKHTRKVNDMPVLDADAALVLDHTAGAGHLVRFREWRASGETVKKAVVQDVEWKILALCSFMPGRPAN